MAEQATGSTFLSDLVESMKRAEALGVPLADAPVFALAEGRAATSLIPVTRVGLTPTGQLVVLVTSEIPSPGTMKASPLILPPSLGGARDVWGAGIPMERR